MSLFETNSLRFNLKLKIGTITQSKIERLKRELGDDFVHVETPELLNVIILKNEGKGISIVLGPNDFTIGIDGQNIQVDFKEIKIYIDRITDSMMLDPKSAIVFRCTGLYLSNTGNSMSESLASHYNHYQLPGWGTIKGVGLRSFYESDDGLSEIIVEPYIKEPEYFFVKGTYNITKSKAISEAIDRMKLLYESLATNASSFINLYLNKYSKD